MVNELEIEDGEVMEGKSKTSQYQVLTADRLESYRKEQLWGYLERSEMKNPVYYRLLKDGHFAGTKKEVTEYLSPGATRWQLDPVPHDDFETQKLSRPPMGTATLGREKMISGEQRRVTHPKSKMHTEPNPKTESESDTVDLPPVRSGDGLPDSAMTPPW